MQTELSCKGTALRMMTKLDEKDLCWAIIVSVMDFFSLFGLSNWSQLNYRKQRKREGTHSAYMSCNS